MRAIIMGLVGLLLLAPPAARADVPSAPGTSVCGGTQPVRIVPIAPTHTMPPYPPESAKAGEQGNSILKVVIAPSGAVIEDAIVQSSGSDRLDLAALDYVKQNWRWQPMPGCRTPVSVAVAVNWRLHNPSLLDPATIVSLLHFIAAAPGDYPPEARKAKSLVMMMGVVSDKGQWTRLAFFTPTGDPALFPRSEELLRARHWEPLRIEGKPMASVAVVGVIWTPPGETPIDPDQFPRMMEMLLSNGGAAPPPGP